MSAGRILVIDDEPQIRRIMRTTLSGAGFEVDDARTGEEGLEKLRTFRSDLVLLDINMSGLDGVTVCREIRAETDIAVIMLTVRSAEADKVAVLDAGADDFVNNPGQAYPVRAHRDPVLPLEPLCLYRDRSL